MRLRTEDVSWRELDGEMVVLDLRTSTYLRANTTGTALLRQLTRDCSRRELVDALRGEFAVDEHQAAADVDAFVHALERYGLLAAPDPPDADRVT